MASLSTGMPARVTAALRPWLMLAVVCAAFSLDPTFRSTFWTASYLPNILQQAATNIILAVGMTFVILTGGIDLSVGSVLALCGVAMGLAMHGDLPLFLSYALVLPVVVAAVVVALRLHGPSRACALAAVVVCGAVAGPLVERGLSGGVLLEGALVIALAVGVACGLTNGLLVTAGRVPPFVVTLGMLTAARGLTVYATDGNSVSGLSTRLGMLGQGAPVVLIALSAVVAGVVLLHRTRVGRYILAIGGSEEAARLSGVPVTAMKTLAYVLCGACAACAAVVLTAKFGLADTGAGANAELNAIAAVVIGGTSLSGGRGSITGSLVGALTIAVLNAGLVLIGLRDTLQGVVIGAVIVAAVMLDRYRRWSAA
ncbi:MAG TPA: ABC transporter permease [Chthonomonadales bacterium]|nr:ABC transporter permease [Chthonomonadales bacterium]